MSRICNTFSLRWVWERMTWFKTTILYDCPIYIYEWKSIFCMSHFISLNLLENYYEIWWSNDKFLDCSRERIENAVKKNCWNFMKVQPHYMENWFIRNWCYFEISFIWLFIIATGHLRVTCHYLKNKSLKLQNKECWTQHTYMTFNAGIIKDFVFQSSYSIPKYEKRFNNIDFVLKKTFSWWKPVSSVLSLFKQLLEWSIKSTELLI